MELRQNRVNGAPLTLDLLDQATLRDAEERDLTPVLDELQQIAGESDGGNTGS